MGRRVRCTNGSGQFGLRSLIINFFLVLQVRHMKVEVWVSVVLLLEQHHVSDPFVTANILLETLKSVVIQFLDLSSR